MASLDKKSLRGEIDQLKAQFEKLCATGKVSDEIKVIMSSLLMIVELMLSIFLERQTKKNNKNSSIPSSQTDKDNSSLPNSGSKGKGRNENSTVANNSRTKSSVTTVTVDFCDVCGEPLGDLPCASHERRTKIDIVFEKVIEHVDAEIKQCPVCDSTVKGKFPADMHGLLRPMLFPPHHSDLFKVR